MVSNKTLGWGLAAIAGIGAWAMYSNKYQREKRERLDRSRMNRRARERMEDAQSSGFERGAQVQREADLTDPKHRPNIQRRS